MHATEPTTAPSSPIGQFSGHSVLAAGGVDVGIAREHRRRRRLWLLATTLGVPTGYLWWRLADGRPFNVFAFPVIDWTVATPILFFVALIGFTLVYYAVSAALAKA